MKSWKTSLIGLLLAVLYALQPFIETGDFDFKKNAYRYSIAIGIAILGYFAKDNDVTGT